LGALIVQKEVEVAFAEGDREDSQAVELLSWQDFAGFETAIAAEDLDLHVRACGELFPRITPL